MKVKGTKNLTRTQRLMLEDCVNAGLSKKVIAEKLGIPKEKTVETVQMHGNTSAASVPLALDWAVKNGRIHEGDTVMLQGVGAGMTWGSVLLKW